MIKFVLKTLYVIMMKGGKRPNAGRKKLNKIKRTYSIDSDLVLNFKITSKIVNELLRKEYISQ